jgi:hypothetical protein
MCNNNVYKLNTSKYCWTCVSNLPRRVVYKTCFRSANEVTNFHVRHRFEKPPMRSLPGAVSTWVKLREREAEDSLPDNSNIRKA